ncbi:BTAD domain-containing putative transcriptional regulator [Nonomuraea sp. NPDC047529]|uniref:BTAD domain-containing putative transcriptional regulator n=1 Tax=Nonomuraea sp. NPDC047529 TaxID=3155623 RepID=UPI0033C8809D
MEVHDEAGVVVELGGRRQRTVLARLLAARGQVVPTDVLIHDLYGDAVPASAVATVQSYVSHLRRVVDPGRVPRSPSRVLVGRPPGYVLVSEDVDAVRLGELVRRSAVVPAGAALGLLEEALGSWRGVPFGEFCEEPWASAEVARLRELRWVAVERRAEALLEVGQAGTAVADLEAEVGVEPSRERLWCLLARALYRTGRQADALAVLGKATNIIVNQYELAPGPELRKLKDDILRQARSLEPTGPSAPLLIPMAAEETSEADGPAVYGREEPLAELRALAERSAVVVAAVSGEPGIGKTCLLEAFARSRSEAGWLVVRGRCHDSEGMPALWPWLQLLQAVEREHAPEDGEALAGLLAEGRTPGPLHEGRAAAADVALVRRNRAVAQWLVAVARVRPLVMVLDDLQWADRASLEMLRDVLVLIGGMAGQAPITVVTAFRDLPSEHGADELLSSLSCYGLLRIRLGGLGPGAVREIAREMGVQTDDRLVDRLTGRTGGNPFFVRECARLLAQGRSLEAVPDGVAELIRGRLAALGPRVVEALRVAAVIGRDFDPSVVAEIGPARTYDLLDKAARRGLLVPGSGRMAFAHDLVRETLVSDIPPLRKSMIHRDVTACLALRPGTDVAVIAHHAVEAGPVAQEEALRWARAAAEQSGLRLAYEEAAAWWGQVIKAHDSSGGDPETHVELLLRQVRALLEAGDAIGARQARAAAVRVADRAETRPDLAVRALTALDAPSLWTLRDPYEAVELGLVHRFETVLARLPEGDSLERARLLGGLAQELYDGRGHRRGDELSAQAVAMARRLGDRGILMRLLNARHLALPQPLRLDELVAIGDELHDLATSSQAPAFELLAQMLRSHNQLEMFDLAGADEAAAHCDDLLERLPLPWPRFQHTLWRANRHALDGRFDDAETLHEQAERQAAGLGVWHARAAVAMGRLAVCHQQGAIADAGPLIDEISGVHPTLGNDARILRLCVQGRHDEARALAARGWLTPPSDWSWLSATCLQAAARAALGQAEACRDGYAALLPFSGRISAMSAVMCMGPVDWYLALLASAAGDHETAARHRALLRRLAQRNSLTWWRYRAE